MNIPAELKYTKSHEWVKEEDGVYTVGLTDYAQKELGDIVFINLPAEGDEAVAGEALADVESVKTVSDVFSPVTGTVAEVNEDNAAVVAHIFAVISKLTKELGLESYRVVSNIGEQAGQSVKHLHFHVLSGRDMTWPPG